MEHKPGAYVVLRQRNDDIPIKARRAPERAFNAHTRGDYRFNVNAQISDDAVICTIPAGERVLYMSSKQDALSVAMRGRGPGPFNFRPGDIVYHLVLWGDRPVWVSSADCDLEPA